MSLVTNSEAKAITAVASSIGQAPKDVLKTTSSRYVYVIEMNTEAPTKPQACIRRD